jgi:hypothetical protein
MKVHWEQFINIVDNTITLSRTEASPEIVEANRRLGAEAGDRLLASG